MWKPGLDFRQEHGHLLVHLGNVHIDSLSKKESAQIYCCMAHVSHHG